MESYTTKEVADELKISVRRVHQLIESGRLPAEKFGTLYAIKKSDIELVRERRNGRPPKKKKEND